MLGLTRDAQDHVTARGPLDGYSNDFAVFAQDDWKVNRALTVFLGLRYEIVGTWHEEGGMLANFILDDGGHHVVPSAEVAAKLPPGLIALDRTLPGVGSGSARYAAQRRQEQLQPARRICLAPRREQQDRPARRLRPLPPDGRRAGHSRLARDERVPLHDGVQGRRSAQRVLRWRAVHGSRGVRQPGHRSEPRGARTSTSTT